MCDKISLNYFSEVIFSLNAINNEHKDRVFKFLFGNPENKVWTLELYNAINNTNYINPDDIQFNTIEDVIYLGMKNDISLIIMNEINLWEHQSTFNPNLPMRIFLYAAKLYEKYIANGDYYQYSSTLQKVPRPKCVCFYNGKIEQPEKIILKLSDAFEGEGDIEVKVTMLNINYGKNKKLMEACKPLNEYAWLVDKIRTYQKNKRDLECAVELALTEMPDDFIIKKFLLLNKAEVKGMFLTEWDQEKVLAQERRDSIKQGINQGIKQANERVATNMLRDGEPLEKIIRYSMLSEEVIRQIAQNMGMIIV